MPFPAKTILELSCCLAKLQALVATVEAEVADAAAASTAPADATLVAGTVAVADTAVTAASRVLLNRHVPGGTLGNLSYSVSNGVGITINSSSNSETSSVTYQIFY